MPCGILCSFMAFLFVQGNDYCRQSLQLLHPNRRLPPSFSAALFSSKNCRKTVLDGGLLHPDATAKVFKNWANCADWSVVSAHERAVKLFLESFDFCRELLYWLGVLGSLDNRKAMEDV